jgi:hypothetical protein
MSTGRIFAFIKRYLFTHPLYALVYLCTYPLSGFRSKVPLYTEQEISALVSEGKSIIRFGDGEINLLLNLQNHYQPYDPVLKKMLTRIVATYDSESPYILSVPRFIRSSNLELRTIGKFNVWLPLKVMFLLKFPKNVPYMDAHNFYYDEYFERVIAPLLVEKTVVLITKQETIALQSKNEKIPWKDFQFVPTPAEYSLSSYEHITSDIDAKLAAFDPNTVVLLFALGPVGKNLVQSYATKGYQSLDIGKVAEIMFTGESIEYLI